MVYKIQDGIQFATRKEWRDYMMSTYYSYHDLNNGKYIKPPNSINGEMFDIINCNNCDIILLDISEQIQIDNCSNCNIFIGISISTIFIRNCMNCKIYCCCKQLRLRECINCTIYSYTISEIHIELSSNLSFGPFNGGYPEHEQQLQECNMSPQNNTNLWHQIYDHNAISGQLNYKILNESEYDQGWFPMGLCERVVPLTKPQDHIPTLQHGQVGESFGLEQMKQDYHNLINKNDKQPEVVSSTTSTPKVNKLGIETALLVASARAKGIDVAVWLCESPKRKHVPVPDFNSRFISLGLAVGIQEDWETKRELDLATSPASLSSIIAVCGEGYNESGTPLINVHTFLCLCEESVEKYLAQAMREEEPEEDFKEEPLPPPPPPQEIQQEEIQPTPSIESIAENHEEEPIIPHDNSMYEPEIPEQRGRQNERSTKGKRSHSEPSGNRKSIKNIFASSGPIADTNNTFEKLLIDVVRHTDLYHKIQVHLGYIQPYTMNLPRDKVIISTPRQWLTHSDIIEAFCSARMHLTKSQLYLLIQLVINFSQKYLDGTYRHRISIDNSIPLLYNTSSQSLNSSLITSTIYLKEKHLLNSEWLKRYLIHLRVNHKIGNWNTWIYKKFQQNTLQNSNYNSLLLFPSRREQVHEEDNPDYDYDHDPDHDHDHVASSSTSSPNPNPNPPPPSSSSRSEEYLIKEFHKALVGHSTLLTNKELQNLIKKYEIISSDLIQQEIENRIEEWILDSNGTRDYSHMLYREYHKYLKLNNIPIPAPAPALTTTSASTSSSTKKKNKEQQEKEQNILKNLEKKLKNKKKLELEYSEKKDGLITYNIFLKYLKENQQLNYQNTKKFINWLQEDYFYKENQKIINKKNLNLNKKLLNKEICNNKLSYVTWIVLEYYLKEGIKSTSSGTGTSSTNEYYLKYIQLKRYIDDMNSLQLMKELNHIPPPPPPTTTTTASTSTTPTSTNKLPYAHIIVTKDILLKYFNNNFIKKLIEIKANDDNKLEENMKKQQQVKRDNERRRRVEAGTGTGTGTIEGDDLDSLGANDGTTGTGTGTGTGDNGEQLYKKGFFFHNKDDAIECGLIHYHRIEKKLQLEYNEWKHEKLIQQKEKIKKLQEQQKNEEIQQNKRQKKSQKAYKKWLKLHSSNKYYSTNEKKKRPIPELHYAEHSRDFDCVVRHVVDETYDYY